MLLGKARSAICVQRLDDSLNSAIHIIYRTWLRSSSMHEPRDPPSKVFLHFVFPDSYCYSFFFGYLVKNKRQGPAATQPFNERQVQTPSRWKQVHGVRRRGFSDIIGNDPSAGSPTETLLRLLLPLNDQV